jgi:hypothetical protein
MNFKTYTEVYFNQRDSEIVTNNYCSSPLIDFGEEIKSVIHQNKIIKQKSRK